MIIAWFRTDRSIPEPDVRPLVPAEVFVAALAEQVRDAYANDKDVVTFIRNMLPSVAYPRKPSA